jgi:6-phosphofructokinase 1
MPTNLIPGNAVIGQAGGPTAVINQSLVGVIQGLLSARAGIDPATGRSAATLGQGAIHATSSPIKRVLGMRHGVRGLVKSDFFDFTDIDHERLERLARTPSAALGSTRDKPDAEYCQRIFEACRQNDIRYFFYIGGNDSSDTCRLVNETAKATGYELRCFHIPKTVDNDLMENDHCPGFPSAARFVAMACMADFMDNISLPGIKINVVMGRHAGFLTAASALARRADRIDPSTDGPQLIYLPEVPFDMDRFVADVEHWYAKKGRCHIAVSEGIQDKDHTPIAAKLFEGETDAHGNVQLSGTGALGDALAEFLKKKLTPAGGKTPRVRADTFGYIQRCFPDASPVDAREARAAGREAARLALSGDLDGSIAIVRTSPIEPGALYAAGLKRVELSAIAAKTRVMPPEFIEGHNNVSRKFLDYCRPLVGEMAVLERL